MNLTIRIRNDLSAKYLSNASFCCVGSHKSNLQRTPNGPYLPETEIWAIIMQLTAGLRAIHQAGFACR